MRRILNKFRYLKRVLLILYVPGFFEIRIICFKGLARIHFLFTPISSALNRVGRYFQTKGILPGFVKEYSFKPNDVMLQFINIKSRQWYYKFYITHIF